MRETFQSVTGETLIKRIWEPKGETTAIVQIVHGMAEHIDCYDETAQRLNKNGIFVVGHNHLGHGQDAKIPGYFGGGGFDALVEDVHTVRLDTQKVYPKIPYFLFGHSMGSFVVRNYCLKHEQGLHGVILSGTGHYSRAMLSMGLLLANAACAFGYETKPAKRIEAISFAGYNQEWSPPRTEKDWLTSNQEKVDRYIADPHCGFTFTAGGYRDMFQGLKNLAPRKLSSMDKNVPVFLYAGGSDPVGDRGAGVKRTAEEFKAAGVKDVKVKIYHGGRHEMHNEPDREVVWGDMIDWMFNRL